MSIKIIKDYQFENREEIVKHIINENNSKFDIQSGNHELGYGREL
jgi:hypothetical protein